MRNANVLGCCLFVLVSASAAGHAQTTIVAASKPRSAIFVPVRVMKDASNAKEPASIWRGNKSPEANRLRLLLSIKDFAAILERISGAKVPIVAGPPKAGDKRIPILIGELARERFGNVKKKYPAAQGFRIVVTDDAVGLFGESDLGTSYALYTLLDQMGCRWYMPSPMGEVLPKTKTIALSHQDYSSGPYTIFRGLWYCDNDFARRNRLGGMELAAGHALEGTVPKKLRETNPEIRAVVKGKPHVRKVKWTHPLVSEAISNELLARLKKNPDIRTFSLSPDDGVSWDESYDTKYDAGDFDPAIQMISKTDRLMVLANRVAKRISAKFPHVKIGVLAYADYTRPPVREKVHPNVVPQIAPITFSRAHPMTDDGEPNNKSLRYLVEGWAKKAKTISYYFYGFYLAEPSAPNPHITKWSVDVPIIYKNHCKFWQPETITNFETHMHGHYLGLRMAWNPKQNPSAIIDELHAKFYGQAGKAMAAYWHYIDNIWVSTPEYSGCGFGHLRRFPFAKMQKARQLMDKALAAAKTDAENARVMTAAASLQLFELFMKCRRDLAQGRFDTLAGDAKKYREQVIKLCDQYEKQYAFGRMGWTRGDSLYGRYFRSFYQQTYDDASRIAKDFTIVTKAPLVKWRFHVAKKKTGKANGWSTADYDDSQWRTTDVCRQTWSSLGLHNYMGSAWYRTKVNIPAARKQTKYYLWIGATDGGVKVFVNGKHIPYVDAKHKRKDEFSGYCRPASFDISDAARIGENNVIALYCTRSFLNELGTGGLLAPAVVYREQR